MKSLILITFFSITFFSNTIVISSNKAAIPINDLTIKEQAFQVLKTKCNICHEKEKKGRVFTLENMDGYSKKIYRQVFKWKKMPKGDEIKLTNEEEDQLKEWIDSLKNK